VGSQHFTGCFRAAKGIRGGGGRGPVKGVRGGTLKIPLRKGIGEKLARGALRCARELLEAARGATLVTELRLPRTRKTRGFTSSRRT